MKKNNSAKKVKRPSKLDRITTDIATYHAHASTGDIHRRNIVLQCEANVVDEEIGSLVARIVSARARRANIEAQLQGLALVVGKR